MNDYFVYSRKIRPDQLKLFIELCKVRKRTWDNIKISVANNSPVNLSNYEWWLSQKLFEILQCRYLTSINIFALQFFLKINSRIKA